MNLTAQPSLGLMKSVKLAPAKGRRSQVAPPSLVTSKPCTPSSTPCSWSKNRGGDATVNGTCCACQVSPPSRVTTSPQSAKIHRVVTDENEMPSPNWQPGITPRPVPPCVPAPPPPLG